MSISLQQGLIRLNILYGNGEQKPVPLTEETLLEILDDGEGIYWELERNESGCITRVIPYSEEDVIKHLYLQSILEDDKDVFYDFKKRL